MANRSKNMRFSVCKTSSCSASFRLSTDINAVSFLHMHRRPFVLIRNVLIASHPCDTVRFIASRKFQDFTFGFPFVTYV